MLFTLQRPTDSTLDNWLAEQRAREFSYQAVGATQRCTHIAPPAGFRADHTRAQLGTGERCYSAAKRGLLEWRQFRLGWLEVVPSDTPLAVGEEVAVVARTLGFWSAHASRIVYVVDSHGPPARFGFAYGTLPGHIAQGEERFLVEWDARDDSVWFDILAYSRPRHPLGWIGYPWLRRMQKLFGRDSVAAMRQAAAECYAGPRG